MVYLGIGRRQEEKKEVARNRKGKTVGRTEIGDFSFIDP
jgi:hypothetical protein